MKPEEFDRFLRSTFASYRAVVKPGASLYVCHASSSSGNFRTLWRPRVRGALPDHLGQEHIRVGLRPVQVPARADLLLPRRTAEGRLVRRQVAIDAVAGEEAGGESPAPDHEAGRTDRAGAA